MRQGRDLEDYYQQVLAQGGVLNKQQTADRFGVSEKTIQRDLDTLRNYFADSEPRREILYNSAKGGYLLDDTRFRRFLTSSEILAVCKILLESRSMVKEEMFPILDKLVQVCTPLDRLNQVKDLISNERFHYVEPQHGRRFIQSLWDIGTAVENHNLMEITYCRTHDGETRVRTVEPVGILFSEYYFYLAAFIEGIDKDKHFQNPQDNSPTIYRIDRIQNYKTLDRHFAQRYTNRFQEGEMTQGNVTAQYMTGRLYAELSYNVPAGKWYTKAAEQECPEAQYELGVCYEAGDGVGKDEAKAAGLYRKAAVQGYAEAQNKLGECYDYGSGVAVDENEAEKWYQKAAENGNETAMLTLADKLFVDGSLDDTDEKMQKAAMWYQRACGTGKHERTVRMGRLLL